MINIPSNAGMAQQQPLYGPSIPQDAIVQALMGGQAQPQQQSSPAAGLAGLSPNALMSIAKYFSARNDPTKNLGFNTPNAQTLIGGTPNAPGFD